MLKDRWTDAFTHLERERKERKKYFWRERWGQTNTSEAILLKVKINLNRAIAT